MPTVSKKQFKLFKAIEHGTAKKKPKGLSKKEAAEFTKANVGKKAYKKLPTKVKKIKSKK